MSGSMWVSFCVVRGGWHNAKQTMQPAAPVCVLSHLSIYNLGLRFARRVP